MSAPDDNPVLHIFARAERVFEARVDTILNAKRQKARLANTPFNARKAKRDARTVAGREKLDALVRRLADLAYAQHAALQPDVAARVTQSLQGAAAAVLATAVLHAATPDTPPELGDSEQRRAEQQLPETHRVVSEEQEEVVKDVLDTSSCSDDCASLNGATHQSAVTSTVALTTTTTAAATAPANCAPPCDNRIFPATESVVNFVLECNDGDDDDAHTPVVHKHDVLHDTDSDRDSDRDSCRDAKDLSATPVVAPQTDWISSDMHSATMSDARLSAPELSDHLRDATFSMGHMTLNTLHHHEQHHSVDHHHHMLADQTLRLPMHAHAHSHMIDVAHDPNYLAPHPRHMHAQVHHLAPNINHM